MNKKEDEPGVDKLSMGISLFIALSVVCIFCAVSIAVLENFQSTKQVSAEKRVHLPNSLDFFEYVI